MQRPLKIAYDGRLWPNGEFGTSRRREVSLSLSHETHVETEAGEFNRLALRVHGYDKLTEMLAAEKISPDHTGLSLVQNSSKTFRKGLKGISSKGKKTIRCAAEWLEARYGRKLLSFGTVTVPSVTVSQAQRLAENWSKIVHLFLRDLVRGLQSKDLPVHVANVTEIQEKREARSGIPALHLHFVYVGRNSVRAGWMLNRLDVRALWKKQMDKWLGGDIDCSATENVVGVKHSASGYLGKYMSKGAGMCADLIKRGMQEFLPSTWWNCTQALKRQVTSAIISDPAAIAWLQSLCDGFHSELFAFIRPVLIPRSDGTAFQIGWTGRLLPKWRDVIYSQAAAIALDSRDKMAAKKQSDSATNKIYAMPARKWDETRYFGNAILAN
jgi:hypothetical protein